MRRHRKMLFCLVTAAATAACALAPTAVAHPSVSPSQVAADTEAVLTFTIDNDDGRASVTAVAVEVPPSLRLVDPPIARGWRTTVTKQRVTLSGGLIPPYGEVQLRLRVAVPRDAGRKLDFRVQRGYGVVLAADVLVPLFVGPRDPDRSGGTATTTIVVALGLFAILTVVAVAFLRRRLARQTEI